MYRIDTEKLANFKDATTGLREGLEEARDNHVLQMGGLQEYWEGEGANSALAAGQELIGQMEDEIASLKGLEEVLGNALENARRLRVQSKKFVEILEGDESGLHYTGHGYAIGAPIGDGVISVEESTVTKVVESCNHAAETAREIEDITYEIDALLGSLEYVHIDISDQTAKIRKDCTKVERLEEYGRSYKRYAEEFIELDRYLCKALEPYQSDENKGLTEMDLRRYNYYANNPGKREKPVEGEALPVIVGGVNAALLGVEPFVVLEDEENIEIVNDVIEIPITKEFLESKGWNNIDTEMLNELNEQLEKYEITNTDAIAYILITAAVETSHGQLLLEIPDVNSSYDESESGAGYFQLTHRGMQETFLDEMGESYTEHTRRQIIAEKYAWESAMWYWKKGVPSWDLSKYVEARGNSVEVFMITQYYINGYPLNQLNPETLTLYGEKEGNPGVIDSDLAYMRSTGDYDIVAYTDGRVDARHNTEYLVIRENCYYLPDRWREREAEYYEYYGRE